jgi:sugar/nucleoside kinase (ribokinase family)
MPEKSFDIAIVGEINPDLILSGDVAPVFGQVEKMVDGMTLTIGSSSAIFACGAARLGLRVTIAGKIGRDEFGSFMRHSLEERGVDTSGIVVDEKIPTGLSVILSQGNDRAILTFPGTIPRLRPSEIKLEWISQARHLHIGSYFIQDDLQAGVSTLFDLAHNNGLTTSLDTNYDPSEKWDSGLAGVIQRTDYLFPNQTECCAIAGSADLNKAIEILAEKVRIVAVKMGSQGAVLRHGQQIYLADSIPVHVIDTVGAGDSFDAGFLFAHLSGWDLGRSLRFATICGALSTRKAGGTAAQPSLQEALDYL